MSPPPDTSDADRPASLSADVTDAGVFQAVLDGYDAVYDALPRSETFSRIWRASAYRGDFPAEFAHISFLTLGEGRRILQLLSIGEGDVLVDVACGAGGPGLWAAQQTGASLIGIDPSAAGLATARQRAGNVGLRQPGPLESRRAAGTRRRPGPRLRPAAPGRRLRGQDLRGDAGMARAGLRRVRRHHRGQRHHRSGDGPARRCRRRPGSDAHRPAQTVPSANTGPGEAAHVIMGRAFRRQHPRWAAGFGAGARARIGSRAPAASPVDHHGRFIRSAHGSLAGAGLPAGDPQGAQVGDTFHISYAVRVALRCQQALLPPPQPAIAESISGPGFRDLGPRQRPWPWRCRDVP